MRSRGDGTIQEGTYAPTRDVVHGERDVHLPLSSGDRQNESRITHRGEEQCGDPAPFDGAQMCDLGFHLRCAMRDA